MQRFVIGPASHGEDGNILLVTLGLSIIIENAMLALFRSDTRSLARDLRLSGRRARPAAACPRRGFRLRRRGRGHAPALAAAGPHRHRQGDPRRRQGKARGRARRHRCRAMSTPSPSASAAPRSPSPPAC